MILDLICSQDSQRVLASFSTVAAQSLAEVGENRLNVGTMQGRASGGPKKREMFAILPWIELATWR